MESGGGSGGGRRWIWCSEAPWKTNRGIAVARPYHGRRTEASPSHGRTMEDEQRRRCMYRERRRFLHKMDPLMGGE
ncbi:hypothetical protein ACS0TY_011711 [Phlomoides rotata]